MTRAGIPNNVPIAMMFQGRPRNPAATASISRPEAAVTATEKSSLAQTCKAGATGKICDIQNCLPSRLMAVAGMVEIAASAVYSPAMAMLPHTKKRGSTTAAPIFTNCSPPPRIGSATKTGGNNRFIPAVMANTGCRTIPCHSRTIKAVSAGRLANATSTARCLPCFKDGCALPAKSPV